MGNINRHGLSRSIPEGVKREVRQRDGFGCVVCGKAIYEYEHFDPEFADATEHKASGIILLCDSCHGKKTRGLLSKETIQAAAENPKCHQKGFSFEGFDIGTDPPVITVGTFVGRDVGVLIQIHGDDVLSILPPAAAGLPFRINARLCDRDGATIFQIVENEWRTPSENWDVEVAGRRITIRRQVGDIVLVIRSDPPHHLVVERLEMVHRGTRLRGREGQNLEVETHNGIKFASTGLKMDGCAVGIQIDKDGINLGVGGGTTYIASMVANPTTARDPFVRPLLQRVASLGKMPRNASCHCGSGLKFKRCHGRLY